MRDYLYLMYYNNFNILKKFSISELILIIFNAKYDNYNNNIRKCAEAELKKRILHLDMKYDDFLHFDDKVIKERGIELEGYLLHPYVGMQNLMEVYLINYIKENGNLLFSERHLCNEANFAEPFFSRVCDLEIENLKRRIKKEQIEDEKQLLIDVKNILENRKKTIIENRKELKSSLGMIEVLSYNDALQQINGGITLNPYNNITDEELYNLLKSFWGIKKYNFLKNVDTQMFDNDIFNYIYGLYFVKNDNKRLYDQRQRLLYQVKNGYEVNYNKENIQYAVKSIKEQDKLLKKVKNK